MKEEILKELRQEQKKSIRRTTILIVALGIIFGSIAGVTAYTISAKEIGYSPKDSSWKVNNVADAIESLKTLKGGAQNYSLDEQVVGTWIDGKPIYQKTIIINNPIYGTNWNNVSFSSIGIENPETFVGISGMIFGGSADPSYYSIYSYRPEMEKGIVVLIEASNNRLVYMNNWISNSSNGGKMYITVQYTKTTDNATNS